MVENIGRGITTMMFSYQKSKNALIFAIIAIGAFASVGIAITSDNSASDTTNDQFTNTNEGEEFVPLGFDNGGGLPNSANILGFDNGGGLPN